MSSSYPFIIVAITSVVTILLRAMPFFLFGGNRETPKIILYLGKVLPYAVMGMLTVYCLKDISFLDINNFAPKIIASIIVVASYVWKKNTLLSVASGTIGYMLLVQLIF